MALSEMTTRNGFRPDALPFYLKGAFQTVSRSVACGGCGERVVSKPGHWCIDCLLDPEKTAAYAASRNLTSRDLVSHDRCQPTSFPLWRW